MKIVSIFLFSLILNLFTLAQAHAQNFYQQNISDNGYKFTVIQKDNYLIIKPLKPSKASITKSFVIVGMAFTTSIF